VAIKFPPLLEDVFVKKPDGCSAYLCCSRPLCHWRLREGRTWSLSVKMGGNYIYIVASTFRLLLRLKRNCKCTLSPPSVLRVLFMISSKRWRKKVSDKTKGACHMDQNTKNRTYYLRIENVEGYVLIAVYLFIYLFICMRVSRGTKKVVNRIAWNLVGCLVIIRGPFD